MSLPWDHPDADPIGDIKRVVAELRHEYHKDWCQDPSCPGSTGGTSTTTTSSEESGRRTPTEEADWLDERFGVGRYAKTLARDIHFVESGRRVTSGGVSVQTLEHDKAVLAILEERRAYW